MFSLSLICYIENGSVGRIFFGRSIILLIDILRESSRRTLSFSAMNETLFCIFRVSFLFWKDTSATKMQSVVWELLNLHFNRFSKTFSKKVKLFSSFFCLTSTWNANCFSVLFILLYPTVKKYAHNVLFRWPMVPRMITGISEGSCLYFLPQHICFAKLIWA